MKILVLEKQIPCEDDRKKSNSKSFDAEGAEFKRRVRRGILLGLVGCGLAGAQIPKARAGATGNAAEVRAAAADPTLVAMKQELEREKKLLVLPGMERPYFIEYRVEDVRDYQAVARFGALTSESDTHGRYVFVEVRVGDYVSDSSSARGDGELTVAPTEDDAAALKYALWSATDVAYKSALKAYAAKQAALKNFQSAPTANDFTPAKAVIHIEPLVAMSIDRDEWKKRIIAASGLFLTAPEVKGFANEVQYSSASVDALVANRYMVDTDGTELRHGYAGYSDAIGVSGQASDGMELSRDNGSSSATAAGLESAASLQKRTIDDLESLHALEHATLADAEDYHGPVLFSGDASADVIRELFVPNVEADRPPMGTTARTMGAYQSSWHTPVLPHFLSVVDDPLMKTYDGEPLMGAYSVDDEGVPVKPVTVVDHGKLMNFLLGREPVKDFPESNGHGRAVLGGPAHSKAGVIELTSSQHFSVAQMRAKLLALAKQQGRDVYEVETLGDELSPRVLYRVTPGGKKTLIRGAVFDELDQRSLRSGILAVGGKPFVSQQVTPVPETFIVPEILFADIAVKRATEQQAKLPYYPTPSATGDNGQ